MTGLQAIAGEFARLGFQVGTGISRLPRRADLEACEVYGFDTASRVMPCADAERAVSRAVAHLQGAGVHRFFKHNDSTLQGHIGTEMRAIACARGAHPVIYVPACPNRRRVTRGGVQVEVNESGQLAEGGLSRDLRECVSRGTSLTTRVLSLAELRAGRAHEMISTTTCDVLVVDAETDADLDMIACAAEAAHCRVVSGSVGLAAALARVSLPQRRFAQPVVVVAGSLQEPTQKQVSRLLSRPDCASVSVSPGDDKSLCDLVGQMRHALARGLHCVVWTPRESCVDASAGGYPTLAPQTLARLRKDIGVLLSEIVTDPAVSIGGLVVAGGTTSDLTFREVLGVTRFSGLRWLCEGMTFAIATDGARPGLPVVTKSGGWGPPGALSDALDWLAVPGPGATPSSLSPISESAPA